jgi:glutamate N-acetyltransferase/amino-acid N-acetyltransferase
MEETIRIPGFLFSSIHAGIKKGNDLDLCLIYSEKPSSVAGLFTKNRVKAAPVLISKKRVANGVCQAILINSGCANACTGEEGYSNAKRLTRLVADALGISQELVLISSTGVIGSQLPMEIIESKLSELVSQLSEDGFERASRAIMTTDTYPKISFKKGLIEKREVTVAGMAKGAGMIFPDLATMLCFILTDAAVRPKELKWAVLNSLDTSFHAISIDGQMSTNDTLIAMANGMAGNVQLNRDHKDWGIFCSLIGEVMRNLAMDMVMDGEGASKFVEIRLKGARTKRDARKLAFAVANSPLVKTALFGGDVNWGRIMSAMGSAGVPFDPSKVDISFNDIKVVKGGVGLGIEKEMEASKILKEKNLRVIIDINGGEAKFSAFTTDLTYDYVRINASYKT